MFSCRLILFCVVAMCLCVESSHMKKCVETDRQALLKLKDGFINGRDILSSWQGKDCCTWDGISCDNLTGHVTSLDFCLSDYYTAALEGNIDSSICELQHLTSLNLSSNYLEGKIPMCIGSLGQLRELKLTWNTLVGSIPPTLGNLSNLETLDLSANGLVGVIPPTLGNLSNLQTLNLSHNYLVSNDLEWVSHLSNLRHLDLSNTTLSGAIDWLSSISKIPSILNLYLDGCELSQVNPKSIHHLNSSTSLQTLSLSGNDLNSSTLSWVLNVSKVLTYLDFSFNSLQHGILNGFANMISLKYLLLSGNELDDSILKCFRSLCQLKMLWLNSNKLSGQLSDHIVHLHCAQNSLEELDLSDNPFSSGPLPDFSWLSSLKTLSLRNTNIVGPLPQSFGHLPYLANLDLSFNQLSGSLPLFEVTKLASLEELDLSHNQLNGTLPYTIGQLSSLRILYLFSNELEGVINEAHLSNLSKLQILDVAQNSFSFNLSSNWVPPFQLEGLYASSCILGPKFPPWLKHQRGLLDLQISSCGISDSFPEWFWDLSSSLSYLNVSHNKLSGALPKSLPSMNTTYMSVWDFSFNNFSGPLPNFPELYALFLSNNMFSGSLSSFCAWPPLLLTFLDLSSNILEGPLLDCWGKFQSLEVLDLANNNFSGRIPNSFGTLQQIKSMHLNNNNFSGEIPSLTLCSNLKIIDFGDNNLEGTLPTWVGHNLHDLIVLRLRANKFRGNIPASLCNLLFLQVLDLSQNNITGEIPQWLSQITAMSNINFPRKSFFHVTYKSSLTQDSQTSVFIDEAILAWKGADREYGKNLGLMTSIDLSCNHLTGEISPRLTMLVALAVLNLSGNNLTGFIPSNIGHMKMLESLDLSRNHLYGRMPSSFSNLSFLSYLNLSFNNLSGRIPLSTQFETFDASTYEGNSGLCGPPLTKHCPWDVISPTGSTDKNSTNEDEDELITFGFYISLGFGFFVGFWGVCGTLLIKTSWRHAYFRFFNNMYDWMHVSLAIFTARMKTKFKVQD